MNEILSLYNGTVIILSLMTFLLGTVALKSARSGIARISLIGLILFMITAVFVMPIQLLSHPKPTSIEWMSRGVPEAEVLHAEFREDVGIFLLLDWYGTPRYYMLDWDLELAMELAQAMQEAREQSTDPAQREQQQSQSQSSSENQTALDNITGPLGVGEGERGEMQTSGQGTVMMRNPFGNPSTEKPTNDDEGEEGNGTPANFKDTKSEAMFYAKPPREMPMKVAPEQNNLLQYAPVDPEE